MFEEIKQELREERTARTKLQEHIDKTEAENREKEAQWKTELKRVTHSCTASNVAMKERMKRKGPEPQSKFLFVQHILLFFRTCMQILIM